MACAALSWLFVAAWGQQALAWSGQHRIDRLQHEQAQLQATEPDEMSSDRATWVHAQLNKAEIRKSRGHWWQMAVIVLGATGTIACWVVAWPQAQASSALIWFILVALLSFPLLILSNALAHHSNPSCAKRARFIRFATISLLITGLATAMQGAALPVDIVAGDAPLSVWALRLLAIVQIALAVEWIIRVAVMPFLPVRAANRIIDDSLILRIVTGNQRGHSANDGFEEQFGVDISQSWAVQFIRRTSPWIFMVLAVATWAMTAVTTLRVDERGLYQRMGHISTTVLEPGLHIHLPWPLGSVRRISYGGIREVRLNTDNTVDRPEIMPSGTGVEDPTTRHDDRIWSKIHGEELFLMIANQPRLSSGDGTRRDSQRPYELYHADVVVTYRVGLDSNSSRQATYNLADADTLIAQIGRRELIGLFQTRTAEDLLFADLSEFSKSAHDAVQERLNALNTGIDIVDVIFEAVHPPINTAETFQRVHGAEKEIAVLLDIARAEAEKIQATAQITAAQIDDEAKADALTNLARARAEQVTFSAERRVYARDKNVFEFERSLQTIEATFADKNLIIVDPQIRADKGLVLDLRESEPRAPLQNLQE
ncbi:MAG: SPFH domain-containing protein [Pseudomonadota bacterium]